MVLVCQSKNFSRSILLIFLDNSSKATDLFLDGNEIFHEKIWTTIHLSGTEEDDNSPWDDYSYFITKIMKGAY